MPKVSRRINARCSALLPLVAARRAQAASRASCKLIAWRKEVPGSKPPNFRRFGKAHVKHAAFSIQRLCPSCAPCRYRLYCADAWARRDMGLASSGSKHVFLEYAGGLLSVVSPVSM